MLMLLGLIQVNQLAVDSLNLHHLWRHQSPLISDQVPLGWTPVTLNVRDVKEDLLALGGQNFTMALVAAKVVDCSFKGWPLGNTISS